MHSFTVWKNAERPNYVTNFDKLFPYSEVRYLGDHFLMKIPASLNNLIPHVDYWGEGRIVTGEGIRGFSNCYNVNHQYQLVNSGPDLDKKIPNRIPVLSYNNCDTSAYIKDNSVVTVTVAGAHISDCAQDVARIVNNDHGTVVVYGVQSDSQEISDLAKQLKVKGLLACPGAALPSELQGLTYYDSHVAFLNIRLQKEELYNNVIKGNYDTAVNMTKSLGEVSDGEVINEIVTRLISSAPRNVMSYAYKLCQSGAGDVVRNHFPKSFRQIFDDFVTIVNKKYNQPLKLDLNEDIDSDGSRLAWGDNNQYKMTNERLSWKIHPVWHGNAVTFKLYNIHQRMSLKLDLNKDNTGDRKVWGSKTSSEEDEEDDRRRFYLEPVVGNDDRLFFIINCRYGQALKLDVNTNNVGDRVLCGRDGVYTEYEQFRWVIATYKFPSD